MKIVIAIAAAMFLLACKTAQQHAADVQAAQGEGDRLTVGTVQKEVRVGMTGAEVASVLGSPNIVTTDENRREVWIYDRISTDTIYSTSEGGVSALVLGGALIGSGLAGGAAGGHTSSSAGAASTTQRTLTVIIKFDEAGKVRDFAYHTTRF